MASRKFRVSLSLSQWRGQLFSGPFQDMTGLDQSEACFHEQVGEDVMILQRER